MKPKIILILSLLFGLSACAVIVSTYFYGVGFEGSLSSKSADWGNLGSYLGGTLGSLFGFFSFMFLLVTVLQQEQQLEKIYDEGLKQNHLDYMAAINEDIRYLLQRKVQCKNGSELEFGDFFMGSASDDPLDFKIFATLISKLLRYSAEYSNALMLYKENFDTYFQYRAHKERVRNLAEFIKSHESILSDLEPVSLGFIFEALDGKQ